MSTNEPMTQEQLDAIQVRVDGSELPDDKHLTVTIGEENLVSWVGRSRLDGSVVSGAAVATVHIGPRSAEMFAHAPQDLTDLLVEVERLTRELREAREVTEAKVQAVADEVYLQLSGQHGDFCIPSREEAAAIVRAALGTGEES